MKTGLAREHGSATTRDKRTTAGVRRFVRSIKNHSVLRPACGCALGVAMFMGDALICEDCGGARLTQAETRA